MLYYLTYSLLDIVFASSVWLLCKSTSGIYKITKQLQLTNKNSNNFYLKNDEYELMVIDDELLYRKHWNDLGERAKKIIREKKGIDF